MKKTLLANDELHQISGGGSREELRAALQDLISPGAEYTCISQQDITLNGETYKKGTEFSCTGTEMLGDIMDQLKPGCKFEFAGGGFTEAHFYLH